MEIGKKELRELICELFVIPKVTPVIENQLHRYVMELGFTYKEIAQALIFYVEVQKGNYVAIYGISAVPNVMRDAKNYFYKLKKQKEEQLESIKTANKNPDIILRVKEVREPKKREPVDMENLDLE